MFRRNYYGAFDCVDAIRTEQCVFHEASSCGDQVVPYICNNHAQMFGIYHKRVFFKSANGIVSTQVVAHALEPLNLPLFLRIDDHGEDYEQDGINRVVDKVQIQNFVSTIASKFPGKFRCECIRRTIEYLMLNNISRSFFLNTWLSDKTSILTLYDYIHESVHLFKDVPVLHQILLQGFDPEITHDRKHGTTKVKFGNVQLMKRQYGSDEVCEFQLEDLANVFVHSSESEEYIASFLVLQAISYGNDKPVEQRILNPSPRC